MKSVTHLAEIKVKAAEPKLKPDGQPDLTKDGKPKYAILAEEKTKRRFNFKEIETTEEVQLSSLVDLSKEVGKTIKVELSLFVMADQKGGRPNEYYQIKSIVKG